MTNNYQNLLYILGPSFLIMSILGTLLINPLDTFAQEEIGSVVPHSKSTITTTVSPLIQEVSNNATDNINNTTNTNIVTPMQNLTTVSSTIDEKDKKDEKQIDTKKLTSKVSDKLVEKWWTWTLSYNSTASPITDTTGERCGEGNVEKDMFYLASTTGGKVERSCELTDEQEILVPILTAFCYSGGACLTDQVVNDTKQIEEETVKALDSASSIEAMLDGIPLNLEKARVTTDPFKLNTVSENPYGISEGKYNTVADGFFLLLKPLDEGKHILGFKGSLSEFGYAPEVTYNLNVVKDN